MATDFLTTSYICNPFFYQEHEPVGLGVIGEAVADVALEVSAPLAAVGPEQVVLFRPPASGCQELVEGVDVVNNVILVGSVDSVGGRLSLCGVRPILHFPFTLA